MALALSVLGVSGATIAFVPDGIECVSTPPLTDLLRSLTPAVFPELDGITVGDNV